MPPQTWMHITPQLKTICQTPQPCVLRFFVCQTHALYILGDVTDPSGLVCFQGSSGRAHKVPVLNGMRIKEKAWKTHKNFVFRWSNKNRSKKQWYWTMSKIQSRRSHSLHQISSFQSFPLKHSFGKKTLHRTTVTAMPGARNENWKMTKGPPPSTGRYFRDLQKPHRMHKNRIDPVAQKNSEVCWNPEGG